MAFPMSPSHLIAPISPFIGRGGGSPFPMENHTLKLLYGRSHASTKSFSIKIGKMQIPCNEAPQSKIDRSSGQM